ncbi:MAG: helix-turn-helix transcriptional regulator [Spirochaetota bacterium]
MTTIALWLNVLAFAFLAASVGLTVVVRSRRPRAWLDWYLVYAASYAGWALIFSVQFFVASYEPDMAAPVLAAGAWIRAGVSAAVAVSLPVLVSHVSDHAATRRALRRVGVGLGAAVLLASVTLRFTGDFVAAAVVNVVFNASLGVVAAVGIAVVRRSSHAAARFILTPVLVVSVAFYAAATLIGVVLTAFGTSAPTLAVFAVALYCVPWAVVSMTRQGRHLSGMTPETRLPDAFVADHGLTPREVDIAVRVAGGDSNAQIAEHEFVSTKTVETHLSSVYRKTGARNRVELVNLIARYVERPR